MVLLVFTLGACATEEAEPVAREPQPSPGETQPTLLDTVLPVVEAEQVLLRTQYCKRFTEIGDLEDKAEAAFQATVGQLFQNDPSKTLQFSIMRRVKIAKKIEQLNRENLAGPKAKGADCDKELPEIRSRLERLEAELRRMAPPPGSDSEQAAPLYDKEAVDIVTSADFVSQMIEFCEEYTNVRDVKERAGAVFQEIIERDFLTDDPSTLLLIDAGRRNLAEDIQRLKADKQMGPRDRAVFCNNLLPALHQKLSKLEARLAPLEEKPRETAHIAATADRLILLALYCSPYTDMGDLLARSKDVFALALLESAGENYMAAVVFGSKRGQEIEQEAKEMDAKNPLSPDAKRADCEKNKPNFRQLLEKVEAELNR